MLLSDNRLLKATRLQDPSQRIDIVRADCDTINATDIIAATNNNHNIRLSTYDDDRDEANSAVGVRRRRSLHGTL